MADVKQEAMAAENGTETAAARDATQEEMMRDHHAETEICSMTAAEEVEAEEETVEIAEIATHTELHHGSRSAKRVHPHHRRSVSQHRI